MTTSSHYQMPVLRLARHWGRLATRRSPGHVQVSRTAGKSLKIPDLPPLRSSAVPVCGRTSPVPTGKKITLQRRRMECHEEKFKVYIPPVPAAKPPYSIQSPQRYLPLWALLSTYFLYNSNIIPMGGFL